LTAQPGFSIGQEQINGMVAVGVGTQDDLKLQLRGYDRLWQHQKLGDRRMPSALGEEIQARANSRVAVGSRHRLAKLVHGARDGLDHVVIGAPV
jgi:hypothetical protein